MSNHRRFPLSVRLHGSLAVAIALASAQNTCDSEPPVRCTLLTSEGTDAIGLFTPAGAPAPAAGAASNACDAVIAAQGLPGYSAPGAGSAGPDPKLILLGLETFFPSPADPNEATTPNAIAVKAEWIGDRIQDAQVNALLATYPYGTTTPPAPPPGDADRLDRPYSFGRFDNVYPDANGICTAKLAPSDMTYPDVPAHSVTVPIPGDGSYASSPGPLSDAPATHVRYEWSNFRAIVSAESLGLLAFADLSITRDGCKADYQVTILSPRVSCAKLDDMGNPVMPAQKDDSLCDPNTAPANPYGSGIHPGIQVACQNVGNDANPDFECLPTQTKP
jgi:hypothetical protein